MDNALHRHLRAAIELDPPTIQPHRRNQEDSGTNGQRGPGIQPAQPPENRLNPKSHAHPKPTGGSRLSLIPESSVMTSFVSPVGETLV